MQEAHWRSSTSGRKTRWLDNCRSQGSEWRKRMSKQSQICCRGARFYPLNGYDLFRVNQKLLMRRKGVYESFLSCWKRWQTFIMTNSLEFGNSCEDLSWNHCTSTPHPSERNGIGERAVRRIKEGASAVLLQPGLDEKWWAGSMECHCDLRNAEEQMGTHFMNGDFGEPLKNARSFRLAQWLTIIPSLRKTSQGSINFYKTV